MRREWEAGQEQEAARLEQRQQHKEALRDVAAAAREGREEAQAAKEQREREAALKRERLKAAFLKKQAAAIMASAAPAANQAAAGSKQPPQLQPQ